MCEIKYMRKNGSREITFAQYRTTDLFLFAVIVALAELFTFAATVWFPQEAIFTFSFALPLSLIVMMRWGWPAVFYAACSAIICCALNSGTWQQFVAFGVGNASIILTLFYLLPVGKKKIADKWYLTFVWVVLAWGLQVIVRSAMFAALGVADFVSALYAMCGINSDCGLLSFVMSFIVLFIVRRFDGIFEDQRAYLIRIGKMRDEQRKRDTFGEQLEELDEESLSILSNNDDLDY